MITAQKVDAQSRNSFRNVKRDVHTLFNLLLLKQAFKKAVVQFDYDPHIIDLWTLGYIYTLNYGLKKMPTANTFFDYFKIKLTNPYDALEKVRHEAEVFRKIIREV